LSQSGRAQHGLIDAATSTTSGQLALMTTAGIERMPGPLARSATSMSHMS
jgi:hypothetical protein